MFAVKWTIAALFVGQGKCASSLMNRRETKTDFTR